MNLYNQLIAGWSLYIVIVSMLTNTISLYDFLVIGAAWTLGCLVPCIDVPFYLYAKHKDRKLRQEAERKLADPATLKLTPEQKDIVKTLPILNATQVTHIPEIPRVKKLKGIKAEIRPTETEKVKPEKVKTINVNRNRYFHTVTAAIICSALVFYLMTKQPEWVEQTFNIPVHYFYWSICFAFAAGYALHLLLDCFGYAPIPLFLIFVHDPYNIPIKIRRSGYVMKFITVVLTVIFITCVIKASKMIVT